MVKIKKFHLMILIICIVLISYFLSFVTFISIIQPITSLEELGQIVSGKLNSNSKLYSAIKMAKVKRYLNEEYIGEINETKMVDNALEAMASSLGDPYTAYLDAEKYRSLKEDTSGQYNGIGIIATYDEESKQIIVLSPIDGKPAQKAGVLPGDRIVRVNDVNVEKMSFEEIIVLIKGNIDIKENTDENKVKLTVIRKANDVEKELTFEIIRQEIQIATVNSKAIDDIGYIRITSFGDNTFKEFKEIYEKFLKDKVKGIVLDLRDNPGGTLEVVAEVADILIPEGLIVYTKDKNGKTLELKSDAVQCEIPIVALMNGNSASASEVLLGALKDSKKATLVGEKSFGKGIVQSVIGLGDGTAIKVTSSEYYTPAGTKIHGIGIEPDFKVELPNGYKSSFEIETDDEDTQLKKALELLKK